MNQKVIIGIYKTLHPTAAKYTFAAIAHGT